MKNLIKDIIEPHLKKLFEIIDASENEQKEYLEKFQELLLSRIFTYIQKELSKDKQVILDQCMQKAINSNEITICLTNACPEEKIKHLVQRESIYIFSQLIRIILTKANQEQKQKIQKLLEETLNKYSVKESKKL